MNAINNRKVTLSLLFAVGLLYLFGGCVGILLAALLRGGYGPSSISQSTSLYQGVIWTTLGAVSIYAAWFLRQRSMSSLVPTRLALAGALAWEAWVFWPPVSGAASDYWMDILGLGLAVSALCLSFKRRQHAH